jgi:hypothetical protein
MSTQPSAMTRPVGVLPIALSTAAVISAPEPGAPVAVRDHFHATVAPIPAADAVVASLVLHGRVPEGVPGSHRNGDPNRAHYRAGTIVEVGEGSSLPGKVEVLITALPKAEQRDGNMTKIEMSVKANDQGTSGASHEDVIAAAWRDLAIEKQRMASALGVTLPAVEATAREGVGG